MPVEYWMAFLSAMVMALVLGKVSIPQLRRLKFGQVVRSDGPSSHSKKQGTPTMGGVIFLVPTLLVTWVWAWFFALEFSSVSVMTILTLGFALVGLADDVLKTVFRRSLGLLARQKLFCQALLAASFALLLYSIGQSTIVAVPYLGWQLDLGVFYWPFLIFLGIGFSNAVNLTDGIDGLAGGTMVVAALAYVFIGLVTGVLEVVIFSLALCGGVLGFLKYNRHPAQVFMGDVGSLGLGGALVSMGVLTRTELLLPIIGVVYVWSTISVMVQVAYFRYTKGKRFFRMSPYHHALELSGWTEKRIVFTYCLISAVFAIIAVLGLARMGV